MLDKSFNVCLLFIECFTKITNHMKYINKYQVDSNSS